MPVWQHAVPEQQGALSHCRIRHIPSAWSEAHSSNVTRAEKQEEGNSVTTQLQLSLDAD